MRQKIAHGKQLRNASIRMRLAIASLSVGALILCDHVLANAQPQEPAPKYSNAAMRSASPSAIALVKPVFTHHRG